MAIGKLERVIGKLESDLYEALLKIDLCRVLSLCEKLPKEEGPLHVITIHDDSVLHVALYTKQVHLVEKLLDKLSNHHPLLMSTSAAGNTVLHEAATDDKFLRVARRMLDLQPTLLTALNKDEETPLFSAARYGQMKMFKLLDDKLQTLGVEPAKKWHKKDDGSTVLHAAIDAEQLELAVWIAKKHEYLHCKKNYEELTALQLLACNPLPFRFRGEGRLNRWLLETFIDPCIKSDNEDEDRSDLQEGRCKLRYSVPRWAKMVKKRKIYHEAVELAELLIKTDKLWMAGKFGDREDVKKCEKNTEVELLEKIEAHVKKTGQGERKKIEVEKKQEERQQTPLLLATQTGCFEIVKKILEMHPQAAEQTDKKGKNIRNKDEERTAQYSPCFQLQRDLILFEKIKEIIPSRFHKHTNITRRQTAEELLALNKEALRENCSIVAVLIATVAFAAAYTVPGGSNPDGSPVFINQTFFGIFTIGDVLSLTFCLTAVIIFLWVLSSSFQLKEFKYALPMKLMLGIACLLFSVTMMMLAFSATIILMIHNNERWTRIALYTAALLPVTVLATIYMPLFRSLTATLKYTGKKIRSLFPKKIEADHDVLVCYTTTSSPTAENSCSFV